MEDSGGKGERAQGKRGVRREYRLRPPAEAPPAAALGNARARRPVVANRSLIGSGRLELSGSDPVLRPMGRPWEPCSPLDIHLGLISFSAPRSHPRSTDPSSSPAPALLRTRPGASPTQVRRSRRRRQEPSHLHTDALGNHRSSWASCCHPAQPPPFHRSYRTSTFLQATPPHWDPTPCIILIRGSRALTLANVTTPYIYQTEYNRTA